MMEKKAVALVCFLLLLFIDGFMVVQIEARMCYSKSNQFHGMCLFKHHSSNCETICKQENFMFGTCSHRRCMCGIQCGGTNPPPLPPHGGEGGGDVGGGGGDAGGGEGKENSPF